MRRNLSPCATVFRGSRRRRFKLIDLEAPPCRPFGLERVAYLVQFRSLSVQLRAKFIDLAQALVDPLEQPLLREAFHFLDRRAHFLQRETERLRQLNLPQPLGRRMGRLAREPGKTAVVRRACGARTA